MSTQPVTRSRGRSLTLARSARLHRLVTLLTQAYHPRAELLATLGLGPRTLYREIAWLRRAGVAVRFDSDQRAYRINKPLDQIERTLRFPDPQLTFAEAAELARGGSPAARRLAELYERTVSGSDEPVAATRPAYADAVTSAP